MPETTQGGAVSSVPPSVLGRIHIPASVAISVGRQGRPPEQTLRARRDDDIRHRQAFLAAALLDPRMARYSRAINACLDMNEAKLEENL